MKQSFIIFSLVLASAAWGQGTSAVQKPGASASWKIAYSPAPAQGASGSAPVSPVALPAEVTYTVSGSLALVETKFDNGTLRTAYLVGGEELSRNSQTGRIRWLKGSEYASADASCTTAYPGFEWVSEKYLVGKDKINGKQCLHYRLPLENAGEGEIVLVQEAWVSAADGLPVAFIKGPRRGEYQFLNPPKAKLEIPREFLEYREARMRRPR